MNLLIFIGNAAAFRDEDELDLSIEIEEFELPEAPELGEEGLQTNGRSTTLEQFSNFLMAVGLFDFFMEQRYFKNGCRLDGCRAVSAEMLEAITAAHENWQRKFPGIEPGVGSHQLATTEAERCMGILSKWHFPDVDLNKVIAADERLVLEEQIGVYLGLLVWLEWWIKYALEHCSIPAIIFHN